MRMKFLYPSFLLLILLSCNDNDKKAAIKDEPKNMIEEGEHLFKINCIQCHMPNRDFAGPALAGVTKRWKDKQLLYEFVKNSQQVIQKDKYAADLFEKWKQAPMLPMPHLTNNEIDAIFAYCDSVSQ